MNETKTQGNWTNQQLKYIQFLASEKTDKSGKKWTEEEYQSVLGVDQATMWRWRQLPGFRLALFEKILENNLDYLPNLVKGQMAAGIRKGKGGETAAFLAIMRQFELLKADKTDNKTELSGDLKFTFDD